MKDRIAKNVPEAPFLIFISLDGGSCFWSRTKEEGASGDKSFLEEMCFLGVTRGTGVEVDFYRVRHDVPFWSRAIKELRVVVVSRDAVWGQLQDKLLILNAFRR